MSQKRKTVSVEINKQHAHSHECRRAIVKYEVTLWVVEGGNLGTKETTSEIVTLNPATDSRELLAAPQAPRKRFALFDRV